jgi:hypothetical protein
VFEEPGGAAGDGEPVQRDPFGGELLTGLALEVGAVVAVGEEVFETVELGLLLRSPLEDLFGGVVPPGAGFRHAHGATGARVGGDEQQRLPSRTGGPAPDLDGELECGEEARSGPADGGLAEVAADLLHLGGESVEMGDSTGGEQLSIRILLHPPFWFQADSGGGSPGRSRRAAPSLDAG